MTRFVHHDRIAEKLEIARTIGLVTNYLVNAGGPARRVEAMVKVWPSPGASPGAVKAYLIRLLDGLVSDHEINVAPPLASHETTGEESAREERGEAPAWAPASAVA